MRLPSHVFTTAALPAAHPFHATAGYRTGGVFIGRELGGAAFGYDPFELYDAGELTNPNMVVLGQIGRGKSALVKSYLWRQAACGRTAWVVDPKGEYGPLAAAWGVQPLRLRPGGRLRLNPLETVAGERAQASLVVALGESGLGRPLLPSEHAAAEAALRRVQRERAATLPGVVDALLEPSHQSAADLRTTRERLASDGRDLALELRRLVHGDLRGLFDGTTTEGIDLSASLVVLDLSALQGSPALALLMTCAIAWLEARATHGGRRLLVLDEAWALLSHLGIARWLRASWKLARARGIAHVAVVHRLSDLAAAGAAGSEQAQLAEGLLSDSETRVILAQPPAEAERARQVLGLTATETALLARLGRGVALWKVGTASFVVVHRLAAAEHSIVGTDAAMSPATGPEAP